MNGHLPIILRYKLYGGSLWSYREYDTVEEAEEFIRHSFATMPHSYEIHELSCKVRVTPNSMEKFNAVAEGSSGKGT